MTLRDAAALREFDAAQPGRRVAWRAARSVAGVIAAILGVLIDQAHKLWMLGPFDIAARGRVALTPFLDLVLVWNTRHQLRAADRRTAISAAGC